MFNIHIFFTKKPKFEHSISIFGFSSPIVEVVMVQRVSYASNLDLLGKTNGRKSDLKGKSGESMLSNWKSWAGLPAYCNLL